MNLRQLFDLSLVGRRTETALEWAGAEYTFGDLDARSNRVAHALKARGLRQGDRLAVYLPNRLEFIDLYLASIKLGVIFVPINILYREREMSHILADAAPALFLAEKDLAATGAGSGPVSPPLWTLCPWMATPPLRWSTLPAQRESARARFLPTTISSPML